MTGMTAERTFRSKSSGIVARLLGDFPIHNEDAFAIVGNGPGHESNGTTDLQELRPTVKGSRGGWGWFQWTGPRRRAFEAYCARNNLDPASDEANYAWMFVELKGSEARAINALLDVDGMRTKVEAFERSYLRAGVKHYPSRLKWARIAEDEWNRSGRAPAPMPTTRKRDMLVDEAEAAKGRAGKATKQGGGAAGGGVLTGGATQVDGSAQVADLVLLGLTAVLLGAGALLLWKAWQHRATAKRLRTAATQLLGRV